MAGKAGTRHVRRAAAFSSRRGALAQSVVFILATLLLWSVSRGKWSDALIDSGREWIVPDALSRGALLYRDVVYWFGPFTPYFHAAFFRLFGSGFSTLVAAGVFASLGILAALWLVLRRVTGREEAVLWTALAVPVLVFMPHAGGSILGMGYRIWHAAAFALFAVAVASGSPAGLRLARSLASGSLCALAGLCRTEWGLAALAAVLLATAMRECRNRFFWREVATAGAGFVLVFGGVLGALVFPAGRDAVIRDGHLLLTGLPEETRVFLLSFSGVGDWRRGLAELLYSSAMWTGVFLLVETLALWKLRISPNELRGGPCGPPNPPGQLFVRGRVRALAGLLLVLALAALFGGAAGAVLFSAAPLLCVSALVAATVQRGSSASAALAACGLLGFLLSYRRPFHISDSAYVGPPLLFAFVSVAGLLRLRVTRLPEGDARRRPLAAFAGALLLLVALAFAGRAAHYVAWEGVPIPGTGGYLSARPEFAREIAGLAAAIRRDTSDGEGLVVFPEGEILNLASGRPNPLRHKLYIPGYLTDENEEEILEELEGARPAAIVIWRRPAGEYGRGLFGQDYGERIRKWIHQNYTLGPFTPPAGLRRRFPVFEYGRLRQSSAGEGGVPSPASRLSLPGRPR